MIIGSWKTLRLLLVRVGDSLLFLSAFYIKSKYLSLIVYKQFWPLMKQITNRNNFHRPIITVYMNNIDLQLMKHIFR